MICNPCKWTCDIAPILVVLCIGLTIELASQQACCFYHDPSQEGIGTSSLNRGVSNPSGSMSWMSAMGPVHWPGQAHRAHAHMPDPMHVASSQGQSRTWTQWAPWEVQPGTQPQASYVSWVHCGTACGSTGQHQGMGYGAPQATGQTTGHVWHLCLNGFI